MEALAWESSSLSIKTMVLAQENYSLSNVLDQRNLSLVNISQHQSTPSNRSRKHTH
jgi:rRNA maturation endonuclease Nob1